MVRFNDLHAAGQKSALELDCPSFEDSPFVAPKSLKKRTVALISTAGLIREGDTPFRGGDASYRTFTSDVPDEAIRLSHISVNFDRISAISDIELVLPRQTLSQMAKDREIQAAANEHYSFMGATDPAAMEESANELAARLHLLGVDSATLLPV